MKLKELEEAEAKARQLVHQERDKRTKELLPIYRSKYIGKCFKRKNSYGTGRKWWIYTLIIGVSDVNFCNDEEPRFKTVNFEYTSKDNVEIQIREYDYVREGSEFPITIKEFNEAKNKMMVKMERLFNVK